jgi:tRNA threonylcarbamoyladenosine biosynthesis protein TsaB
VTPAAPGREAEQAAGNDSEQPAGSCVLGFDTATPDTAVAATRDGEVVAEVREGPGPGAERPAHATALLPAVERAAAAAGGWDAIDRIAVGVGPGSFTGLRVGVTAARALALGLDKPLIAIGTLSALAAPIAASPLAAGRPALAVLDARRGEAFALLRDADGADVWPAFVASPDELAARVAALPEPPLAAGNGSLRFRRQLEDAGAFVAGEDEPLHRISAASLCRLAETASPTAPEQVAPIYLRRPDAEIWRDRQRRGGGR